MDAILVLEDGKIFRGRSFGASGERCGEVVFNTSMAGYQEIITDPSYKGQIVAMTYPLIGNYGINKEDAESRRIFLEGFVVKEYSSIASNWRSHQPLADYLRAQGVLGLEGVDTRELALHIRKAGAMKSVLSTVDLDESRLAQKARGSRGLIGLDLVKEVTVGRAYRWSKARARGYKVVVLDCGLKYNILRELSAGGCRAVVVPADTGAGEILKLRTAQDIEEYVTEEILLRHPQVFERAGRGVHRLLGGC